MAMKGLNQENKAVKLFVVDRRGTDNGVCVVQFPAELFCASVSYWNYIWLDWFCFFSNVLITTLQAVCYCCATHDLGPSASVAG